MILPDGMREHQNITMKYLDYGSVFNNAAYRDAYSGQTVTN